MKEEDETRILSYLQEKLSPDEQHSFESWLNASEENRKMTEDFKKVWQLTASRLDVTVSSKEDWQRLQTALGDHTTAAGNAGSFRHYYGIAAAVLLLVVSSAVIYLAYFTNSSIVVETATNSQHVTLPDGSEVWMNAESRLAYMENFSEDRFVILEGEGFFSVQPDPANPFRVRAGDGEIKVVGTSFNVKAYKEEMQTEVYVVTGKVDFHTTGAPTGQLLTPGFTGIMEKKNKRITAVTSDENDLAWQSRKLVFKKSPLSAVVKALRSYYKADILVRNQELLSCRFTGTFNDVPLEEVMETLKTALDLNVAHVQDTYTLDGAGCNE